MLLEQLITEEVIAGQAIEIWLMLLAQVIMEQLIAGKLIEAGGLMLLEQLIMEQLIVLEAFGLASDTGTYTEQLIVEQLIMEQFIVEVLGLTSDTGTYTKEKQDENDLSTPNDRPRTLWSTVDRGFNDRGRRIDAAGTADRGSVRTSQWYWYIHEREAG
jgi:hypothetical protein